MRKQNKKLLVNMLNRLFCKISFYTEALEAFLELWGCAPCPYNNDPKADDRKLSWASSDCGVIGQHPNSARKVSFLCQNSKNIYSPQKYIHSPQKKNAGLFLWYSYNSKKISK